jgi:hypothetical protein
MNDIIIHPNKYIFSETKSKKKHFIFDLDETLGSFSDFYVLWKGIQFIKEKKQITTQNETTLFHDLLNLYPEFLRYGITTILQYLYHKKTKKQCGNVYIYTNNQCDPPWVEYIIDYFETEFQLKGLFEKPICAFKINNRLLDRRRTSNEKKYSDFLKCTLLPKFAELCFIDDSFFPKMKTDQVFYIQPKPYQHCLGINEIIYRFTKSKLNEPILFTPNELNNWYNRHGNIEKNIKTYNEKEIDIEISRKLMYNIREFFYLILKKDKTKRNRSMKFIHRRTKKNI